MKKMASVRLVFDRKKVATRRNASNPKLGGVQIEVMHERRRKYFTTGVRVYADEWRGVAPVYVHERIDMMELNGILDKMLKETVERIAALGNAFDLDSFAADVRTERKDGEFTFLDFMQQRIDERSMRESTRNQHKVVLRMLEDYGKLLRFDDLTAEKILRFDDWVHLRENQNGERICQASVYSIHKRLKVYVREAFVRGHIDKNPYDLVSIQRGQSKERTFLTEDELHRLMHTEMPTESLKSVRDLAVFQAFTGLGFSDLVKFDWSKAEKRGKHWFIRDARQKTGETFQLLLLSPAIQVLEKYNYCLPMISSQQYNLRLKAVMDIAGIDKSISSHCLRHTFAIYALNSGLAIEVIGKILGQKKISTTQIYAKLLGKTVEDAMAKLDKKIDVKCKSNCK